MSVARAEAQLASILLVELMAAITEEEDHQDDEPGASPFRDRCFPTGSNRRVSVRPLHPVAYWSC